MTSGGGSESYSHHESISSQSAPVIQQTISYPSGSSEYSKSFSEKVTSSGGTAPIVTVASYPSGGSERYSHSRFSETSGGGGIVPLAPFPITTGGGSSFSSSRHSERVSQAVPAIVPIFPTGGSNSRYSSSQVSHILQTSTIF